MNTLVPLAAFRSWLDRQSDACAGPVTRRLVKRETLSHILPAGQSLQCVRGVLWITSNADRRDVLLRESERFSAGSKARLLIEALEDSVVKIP